ncbi:TPA: hypothetical protein DIC38_00870 [Candidatus Nomurabacteria bacterium]|nr:MAG: hypothetical protein O210_OD1C00001G0554 [Parcubacteria bacterium RAAC4_OD1_1]HCY26224.1 hypothetical protein [Candidatus Nomurabacteria bacterium]
MEKINEPKSAKLETEDKDLKRFKEKLSKIRIDESFIKERKSQLLTKGYGDEESRIISSKEAMIKADNDRIELLKEYPDFKDGEKRINEILIKRDTNQKEINELLKKDKKEEEENKNIKSNRQLLREAEDKLRNMSVDMGIIKKEKSDLLGEGYPFEFSEKLSSLNGEIRLLQNKIQILIENPKIENGIKLRKNLEEKLSKLEKERNILLTSKPEPIKNETTKNEVVEKNEKPVVDEYDEAEIDKEIKNFVPKKEEQTSKKINWGKLNPFSWFKKDKKENDNSSTEGELLDKKRMILSHTGAAPASYEDKIENEEKKEENINEILDKKINAEKNKVLLSHTGAAPAFYEDKIEVGEKKEVKNEKKKTLYTKEQQKEFFDGLKEKLKNGEISEIDFKDAILKRTEEIHNFEKGSVYKAMDKWDNWGKNGGVGKYAKMAINIAMIAGVSSLTVNGMAGLTERVVSRTLIGTAAGTGLGGLMTWLDKLPPEKKSKVQKIIKGILIGGSAIFTIGTGGIVPGLAIGASTAFGYGISRYYKNWNERAMRSENIENLKEIPIDLENLDKNTTLMEFKMKKMLKSADRTKVLAKIASAGMAMALSIGTLEVSGLVHDHLNDTSSTENVDDNTNKEKIEDSKNNEVAQEAEDEKTNGAEKNDDTKVNNEKENNNTQTEDNKKIEDNKKSYVGEKEIGAVANKGQGAISTIKELKESLEKTYENVPEKDIPENVKHIIDTDAHDLAKEYGMYRPGEEAESAKVFSGDKIIFDQETGEVKFHQEKTGEDVVLEKGKEFGGDMFDSGKFKAPVENLETEIKGDETSQFEKDYPQTSPENEEFEMGTKTENSNIIIDGEEIKAPEISEKELLENKKLAESYGVDSERYRGETDSEYLNRMKEEIAEEKESLKQELASSEKMSLDKTLKMVHGEKLEIEKLKDLKEITRGYEGATNQSSLKDIMEKIKEQGLKAIITKDIGENPTDAQVSINEKMRLVEKSLSGQKGYNYEFAQKLPDGNVKILHIKLFKE